MSGWTADILGEPYQAQTITLPPDDEGPVVATLVRRPSMSPSGRAVLYLHGFCDYFFQKGLADFYADLGYDFYALDLRKYGRSLLPHQTPNFCRDLAEYHAEIDEAVRRIRDRDGHLSLVVNAHSTGALVVALWADERRRRGQPVPDAFVFNSPWLDLAGSLFERTVATWLVDRLGAVAPYRVIPRTVSGVYADSLHCDLRGEWEFDLRWKPRDSVPVRAGWLRAMRRGHARVHAGIDVGAPVLVLSAARSSVPESWNDDVTCTDVVLDVRQIARWSPWLGHHVTVCRVPGAIHDVVLSAQPARDLAYAEMRGWLSAHTPRKDPAPRSS